MELGGRGPCSRELGQAGEQKGDTSCGPEGLGSLRQVRPQPPRPSRARLRFPELVPRLGRGLPSTGQPVARLPGRRRNVLLLAEQSSFEPGPYLRCGEMGHPAGQPGWGPNQEGQGRAAGRVWGIGGELGLPPATRGLHGLTRGIAGPSDKAQVDRQAQQADIHRWAQVGTGWSGMRVGASLCGRCQWVRGCSLAHAWVPLQTKPRPWSRPGQIQEVCPSRVPGTWPSQPPSVPGSSEASWSVAWRSHEVGSPHSASCFCLVSLANLGLAVASASMSPRVCTVTQRAPGSRSHPALLAQDPPQPSSGVGPPGETPVEKDGNGSRLLPTPDRRETSRWPAGHWTRTRAFGPSQPAPSLPHLCVWGSENIH